MLSLPAQFFQLIKTGSALADVGQQVGELSIRGLFRNLQEDFAPRAVDALRIGIVLMHHAFKRVEQFLFRVHSHALS